MTSENLTQLVYVISFISVLLILGTILRAKVTIFQKTFLPASVIGGFLGLLLGPIILGDMAILKIPQEWIDIAALLPGVLIVPIVAAVPLGIGGAVKKAKEGKKASINITKMFLIMGVVSMVQHVIGFAVNIIFSKVSPELDIYQSFGWELQAGFAGGHGTAGVIGGMLKDLNVPYWSTAQGVATTCATFGILGGILIGIAVINKYIRKGEAVLIKTPGEIPKEMKIGYNKDISKQPSIGRETTISSSIDSLGIHLAIIMSVCGAAYIVVKVFKGLDVTILSGISVWAYAIIIMFIVWKVMCKMNLQWLVDSKVKSKITGSLTDYAIVAAIISLPVKAVMAYVVPMMTMIFIGLLATFLITVVLCRTSFKEDCWLERSMCIIGMNTGVFLTGLLLLRVCDPESKLPVINDYSIAYTFTSTIGFSLFPLFQGLIFGSGGIMSAIGVSAVMMLGYYIALIIINKNKDKAHA